MEDGTAFMLKAKQNKLMICRVSWVSFRFRFLSPKNTGLDVGCTKP